MKLKNIQNHFLAFLALIFISACNPAQSQSRRASLPGMEVQPGSELMDVSFFKPFTATGMISEFKDGKNTPFRKMKKEMKWINQKGKRLIEQILTYSDPASNKVTGIHKTHYDPNSLQVLYWEYLKDGKKAQFAFKANGTKLSGTQQPGKSDAKWSTADLGVMLFQNETRELLFRSLSKVPVGTEVKFPVIGMQPPFHGWVAYKYASDKEVNFNGKKVMARQWQAVG